MQINIQASIRYLIASVIFEVFFNFRMDNKQYPYSKVVFRYVQGFPE